MKTRNLRIGAMVATLVVGLVLVGAAKEWDYSGQSGYLSMSPSTLEAKPDDKPIKLLLSGMGKDGALLEGDVHITGECGFINGVAAKTGGRAYLSGGVGSAIYRCDAPTEKCCVGAQKFVAKLGSYEAGAAMSLRMDAETSSGADAGTTEPITFSPDKVHLIGSLWGLPSSPAAATLERPDKPFIGFDNTDGAGRGGLSSRGTILYTYRRKADGRTTLAEAVPDNWAGGEDYCRSYPSDPRRNDRILATCDSDGINPQLLSFPDSDAIFFKCSGEDWKGTEPVPAWFKDTPPHYLGYKGTALLKPADLVHLPQLRKSDGTVIDFSKALPTASLDLIRAHPKGYWFTQDSVEHTKELWNLDFDGTVSKVGDYADIPLGLAKLSESIDGTGTRYWMTAAGSKVDILRIPLKPDPSSIVYTYTAPTSTDCKSIPSIAPAGLFSAMTSYW